MFVYLKERFKTYFNKNLGSSQRNPAFTLAEILIVLGIIGIIAALTIPTLIENVQKDVTVTKLKKSYTVLYQAVKLSEVDNGPTVDWDIPVSRDPVALLAWFKKYLAPYMKYLKVENAPDGQSINVYLADGTVVTLWNNNNEPQAHAFVYLYGLNNKSTNGRDVFLFFIGAAPSYWHEKNNEVRPYDSELDENYSTTVRDRDFWKNGQTYGCNANSGKAYCAGLIMYDGWKISDDYPW